jgi:hypothetical protein
MDIGLGDYDLSNVEIFICNHMHDGYSFILLFISFDSASLLFISRLFILLLFLCLSLSGWSILNYMV